MLTYPWSVVLVLGVAALVWAGMLGVESFLAWRRRSDPMRVSEGALRAYSMDELRQGWHQPLNWPKQKKGAQAFWDRKPTRLRDASRDRRSA